MAGSASRNSAPASAALETPCVPEIRREAISASTHGPVPRIRSEDLFRDMREVEIDHEGRIYRLRLTQLNKLILTA